MVLLHILEETSFAVVDNSCDGVSLAALWLGLLLFFATFVRKIRYIYSFLLNLQQQSLCFFLSLLALSLSLSFSSTTCFCWIFY